MVCCTDGVSDSFGITDDIVVEAGDYTVLAARASSTDNGGIDNVAFAYDRSSFRLNNYDSISSTTPTALSSILSPIPMMGLT